MSVEHLGIEIEAIVKELGQLKSLVSGLQQVQQNAGLAQQKMNEFQKQTEALRTARESFQSLNLVGAEMMAVGGGILAVFRNLGKGFIDAASESNKYRLTLETLFKSPERAEEELAWAEKFADLTPYALRDVVKGTVIFRSFGLDARKYFGMAGDMAAAFGGDAATLQSAVIGVAKAMASGAGAMDILRESFGITGDQLKKFGWKGKNDIAGFRKALEQLLTERFAGAMKKQSETFGAYLEGLRDYWRKFQTEIGRPLLAAITPDIAQLYAQIRKLFETRQIQKWANVVKDIFLGIYNTIKNIFELIGPPLKLLFEMLTKHPEIAKAAGKWLFLGGVFTTLAGGALFFTGMLGQTIISILQLRLNLLKLPGVAGKVFSGMDKNILGVLRSGKSLQSAFGSLGSSLASIGALGASAFIGWQIGRAIGEITGLDKVVQDLYGHLFFARELKMEKWYALGGKEQLEKIRQWRKDLGLGFVEWKGYYKDIQNVTGWAEKYGTREALLRRLELEERILSRQFGEAKKVHKPEIPGIPPPPEVTRPYEITAETRPEIDNYYYTIHFERDSVQINTLELTPEKFQKALFEFFKQHSLAPQTP